jgi:hypothetical protein
MILTASRERYRGNIAKAAQETQLTLRALHDKFLECYSLAIVDVEMMLLKKSDKFVNAIRKFRGLSELPSGLAVSKPVEKGLENKEKAVPPASQRNDV